MLDRVREELRHDPNNCTVQTVALCIWQFDLSISILLVKLQYTAGWYMSQAYGMTYQDLPLFGVHFCWCISGKRKGFPNKTSGIKNMASSICHFVTVISVGQNKLWQNQVYMMSTQAKFQYSRSLVAGKDVDCDRSPKVQVEYQQWEGSGDFDPV